MFCVASVTAALGCRRPYDDPTVAGQVDDALGRGDGLVDDLLGGRLVEAPQVFVHRAVLVGARADLAVQGVAAQHAVRELVGLRGAAHVVAALDGLGQQVGRVAALGADRGAGQLHCGRRAHRRPDLTQARLPHLAADPRRAAQPASERPVAAGDQQGVLERVLGDLLDVALGDVLAQVDVGLGQHLRAGPRVMDRGGGQVIRRGDRVRGQVDDVAARVGPHLGRQLAERPLQPGRHRLADERRAGAGGAQDPPGIARGQRQVDPGRRDRARGALLSLRTVKLARDPQQGGNGGLLDRQVRHRRVVVGGQRVAEQRVQRGEALRAGLGDLGVALAGGQHPPRRGRLAPVGPRGARLLGRAALDGQLTGGALDLRGVRRAPDAPRGDGLATQRALDVQGAGGALEARRARCPDQPGGDRAPAKRAAGPAAAAGGLGVGPADVVGGWHLPAGRAGQRACRGVDT
jgi:hypothetical protein